MPCRGMPFFSLLRSSVGLLHVFILRLSVSMDHNGVAVHVCWVRGWAVGRGLGRLSHTSPGPVRLPPPSAC
jgi:hypothetical protein